MRVFVVFAVVCFAILQACSAGVVPYRSLPYDRSLNPGQSSSSSSSEEGITNVNQGQQGTEHGQARFFFGGPWDYDYYYDPYYFDYYDPYFYGGYGYGGGYYW